MKRTILGALALALSTATALAQSSPGLTTGQVPTAAQWNSYFAAKQDFNPGGGGVGTPGGSSGSVQWNNSGAFGGFGVYNLGTHTLQLDAADAATANPQTLKVQSVVAGTANAAGADWTYQGSLSTGTGAPGRIIFTNGFNVGSTTPQTFTVTLASPAVFTIGAGHNYVPGEAVRFTTTGTLPTGLSLATTYYVIPAGLNQTTFEVSASPGGAAINTSGSQSGTHTSTPQNNVVNAATPVMTIGPAAVSGTAATPALKMQQTWKDSLGTTFLEYDLNTDTPPAQFNSSNFFNYKWNGTSVLNLSGGDGPTNWALVLVGQFQQFGGFGSFFTGPVAFTGSSDAIQVGGFSRLAFGNATPGTDDTFVFRDNTAGIFGFGSGPGVPESVRIYNSMDTFSSTIQNALPIVNFERFVVDWSISANTATVGTQSGGTGVGRNIFFTTAGTSFRFGIQGAGSWLWVTNAQALATIAVQIPNQTVFSWSINNQADGTAGSSLGSTPGTAPKVVTFGDGGNNANGWMQWAGETRVTADVSNATTTLANATGLAAALQAGRTYAFDVQLSYTDVAASGIQAAMVASGGLTATNIIYDGYIVDSAANGIKGSAQATALGGVVASSTTTGTAGHVTIQGTITVNVAGTLNVQFANNTGVGPVVTKRGSRMIVHDMP